MKSDFTNAQEAGQTTYELRCLWRKRKIHDENVNQDVGPALTGKHTQQYAEQRASPKGATTRKRCANQRADDVRTPRATTRKRCANQRADDVRTPRVTTRKRCSACHLRWGFCTLFRMSSPLELFCESKISAQHIFLHSTNKKINQHDINPKHTARPTAHHTKCTTGGTHLETTLFDGVPPDAQCNVSLHPHDSG